MLALAVASATCWRVAPPTGRLRDNVGHQGEELTYRLVNAALRRRPEAIWWPRPLRWSTELLNATLRDVKLAFGDDAPGCERFATIKPQIKPPQWSSRDAHATARKAVYAACGLGAGRLKELSVRVLGRDDETPRRRDLCGGRLERRIADIEALRAATVRAARRARRDVDFDVVNVSSRAPGDLCAQVARFATADVLVSIHGAHLVNAPFLPPRGLLFEVLPWAHSKKRHHARLLQRTDISYDKLCGRRPAKASNIPTSESLCEGRSQAARRCTAIVRDCHPTRMGTHPCVRPCDCIDHFETRLVAFFARVS
ncbi:hypothetical protein CTAYLR_004956 [Chrysophaeum taylorii]|uniref:Glycosyltransferase 61 catalytic domain-containing protein n=1 Tax=Chrysophaeum taylorii TaxID=2483200 RepID=A0AAD7XUY6_9STRA|nr:hypothetical protein CTAYLR_004956 [Chrysophaeum taylorii]